MAITFTTPSGATVTITAGDLSGFNAAVNGQAHTSLVAKFVRYDSAAGPHVALSGKIKAQISEADVEKVATFFTRNLERQEKALADYSAEYARTHAAEIRSAWLTTEMDREDSSH